MTNLTPYEFLRCYLLQQFNRHDFAKIWCDGQANKTKSNNTYNPNANTKTIHIKNKPNLNLEISFPGYKTKITNHKVTYDYRVSLKGIAISHANIIVDLYNKAIQLQDRAYLLNDYLLDIAERGYDYNRQQYMAFNQITAPDSSLLNRVEKIHSSIGKQFGRKGNEDWNYSLDELSYMIMFIVLQEDINYPPPHYEGRKMPFARYLEAVYLAQHPQNGTFNLKDVFLRTLAHHKRPIPYKLDGLQYYS
ncbi:hypothetical protein SH601_05175 [Gracilibacillus sp. S3-1-1]|uniref:Uncharacterized protein n=1 Tax=Gracilibacillus pellucidus TaxID=3095368 RepID=A0ACC6M3A6_9BACI|nr:hypothetical protein [Gracilibacillus sp. S3-1-1]MDX8045376.1 hypothetical protein [Gracilibacillus sp. S3-1-1]